MKGIIVATLVVVLGLVSRARAECVELPGSYREIDLPAGWTAAPHALYAGGAQLSNPELGAGPLVFIAPPAAFTCSSAELITEGNNVRDSPQTSVFSGRYQRFLMGTSGSDVLFIGCKDSAAGAFAINVAVPAGADTLDPRWLAITEAVADSIDYDIQCLWEPDAVTAATEDTSPAVKAPVPWRLDASAVLGGGQVFDAPPTLNQLMDVRLTLEGINRVFAFGPNLRAGIATGGGRLYELGFRGGLAVGRERRISVLGAFAVRAIHGEEGTTPRGALMIGVRLAYQRPLPSRRLKLLVLADLDFFSPIEDRPDPEPDGLGSLELEPALAVMLGRGPWLLGVEARELDASAVVSAVFGVRYDK